MDINKGTEHEPPCRSRRWPRHWLALAVALLSALAPAALLAQNWDSQHFALVGQQVALEVNVVDPSFDRVTFLLAQSPDNSDSFGNPATVPIVGSTAIQTLNLGSAPGARQVLFCLLTASDSVCSPNQAIWVGAVQSNCIFDVQPLAGTAPLPVVATAECLLDLGPGIGQVGGDYQWTLPAGATVPAEPPPLPVQAQILLSDPGSYPVGINPRVDLFIPSADVDPEPLLLGARSETVIVSAAAQAPQISLTSPEDGAEFTAPADFMITAAATPGGPGSTITQVAFLINGQQVAVVTTPPYQTPWPSTYVPGVYTISARATDDNGLTNLADPIQVVILEPDGGNLPPIVQITAPAMGSTFVEPAQFEIEVSASDPDGEVVRVEFLIDDVLVGERTAAPYRLAAPEGLTPGARVLTARATDDEGASTTSAPVQIRIVREADRVILLSPIDQLRVQPGQDTLLLVQAANALGTVADVDLQWRILGGQGAEVPPDADCTADDTPPGGVVRTDASGEASIVFVAGCASGMRTLEVWIVQRPDARLSLSLPGPDQAVGNLAARIDGEVIVARVGEPTPVPVLLTTAGDVPVVAARVNFTLEPASAGTLSPSAVSGQQGIAIGNLVLTDTAIEASVLACIAGRDDVCAILPVRSLENAVLKPARELLAPIVRSAIDAPRVQMNQVRSRMYQLRNLGGHGFSNEVRVNIDELGLPLGGIRDDAEDESDKTEISPLGYFAGGDISVGKRPNDDGSGFEARTRGLTIGVDYRFSPAFVAGVALGGLRTATDLANGGDQEASGVSMSMFGQWLPSDRAYLAGILHAGRNRYDIERPVGSSQDLRSDTDSRQQAGQLEAGYSMATGAMRFSPFLRYEYIRARIDPIRESGALDALEIGQVRLRSSTVSGGMTADYTISSRSGVWIPSARIEYFHENLDQDEVLARLVAGNIDAQPLTLDGIDRSYGTAGFTLNWMTALGSVPVSMLFGFETSFARDDYRSRRFMFALKIPL